MLFYRRFSWFTLFYSVSVILWGAYVRASGSGAGCGQHWPLCNGSVIPRAERIQTLIEYSHRLSSGMALVFVFVLFALTWKLFPKGSFQRKTAALSLVAMISEALVGAMLVLLRLVEHDQSMDRVFSISLHLVNTLFLLAALTMNAQTSAEDNPKFFPEDKVAKRWLIFLYSGFAVLGAFGAMAALGDTLFPVKSLSDGLQGDFDGKRHFLERIRIVHPIAALAWFTCLWIWVAGLWENVPELTLRSKLLLGTATLNICLGLLNVVLLAPIWMQITHLLVADLTWILFVSLSFSAASRWR